MDDTKKRGATRETCNLCIYPWCRFYSPYLPEWDCPHMSPQLDERWERYTVLSPKKMIPKGDTDLSQQAVSDA
jgi:hypothetical protein